MRYERHGRGGARRLIVLTTAALVTLAGCSDLIDVENPNNIAEESLENPQSATQQANGVLASTSRMLAAVTTPYATATDELDWIGSRDAWNDLETGAISIFTNEFTDVAFPWVGEARFLGDATIARLERFDSEGVLRDRTDLARTYLYTAITYATIADMFDDFALSNKTNAAPAIGRANMGQMYDTAIDYLTKGLAIADAEDDTELEYALTAVRARTRHAKAVWALVTPKGTVPANPLVNVAAANADAQAALALLPGPDDRFRIFTPTAVTSTMTIHVFFEVNGRNEMRIGTAYRNLRDPVTGLADATAAKMIEEFTSPSTASQEGHFTIVSDRELRLILAEAAQAAAPTGAPTADFLTHINAVRGLDGKVPYAGTPSPLAILKHERMANLFLQRRRLIDLYRFGETVAEWRANANFESAFNTPGLLFPVPNIERLANPCITDPSACGG